MTKKINEIISQYNAKIRIEKFQALNAISNDRKLVQELCLPQSSVGTASIIFAAKSDRVKYSPFRYCML